MSEIPNQFCCDWDFDYCDPHNGKYYWTCKKHDRQTWFGFSVACPNEEKIHCPSSPSIKE